VVGGGLAGENAMLVGRPQLVVAAAVRARAPWGPPEQAQRPALAAGAQRDLAGAVGQHPLAEQLDVAQRGQTEPATQMRLGDLRARRPARWQRSRSAAGSSSLASAPVSPQGLMSSTSR